jgi:hypothetical protein
LVRPLVPVQRLHSPGALAKYAGEVVGIAVEHPFAAGNEASSGSEDQEFGLPAGMREVVSTNMKLAD